ncbi:MAG: hypothetical protein WDW36_006649 [Sanguina aurantia]
MGVAMLQDPVSVGISVGATVLALILSIGSRYIIRILFMVPFYCLCSLGSLHYRASSIYFDTPRDCYEAWVIYNFMSLFMAYVGGPGAVVVKAEGHVLYPSWKMCTCCIPAQTIDGFFLRRVKQGVLQFVILKPILAALALVLSAFDKYENGNWALNEGYIYIVVVYNFCYTAALYALLLFYLGTEELLHAFNPLLKLILVKTVIFLTFWQGILISMFSTRVRLIDPSDQNALQDWIVIIEMLLAGIGMLFAFPYTEFKKGGSLTGWNMGAFTHAISIQDVISDTLHQFNPNYQTYVLYSDGGPADNVKKKKFRKRMPIDADDEFEAHDASEGRATGGQKKRDVAFDVERGAETMDADPEGQEWVPGQGGQKASILNRILKPKTWIPGIHENERRQAELLDSDSDAELEDDDAGGNQLSTIMRRTGSDGAKDTGTVQQLWLGTGEESEDDRPLYSSNIAVLLLNKFLLTSIGFRYPVFLTLCHMMACAVLGGLLSLTKVTTLKPIKTSAQLSKVVCLSCIFCLTIVLGNASLRFIPVSFSQAIGSATVLFTAALAYTFQEVREANLTYAALLPIALGVMIASGGEPMFNAIGFTLAMASAAGRAAKSVVQSILMTDPSEKLDPLSLLFYMSSICVMLLVPAAMVLEPGAHLKAQALLLSYPGFGWWLLGNSLLAYAVNLTNFLVTKYTSALTLQVLGNAKGVVAACVSVLIFTNPVTAQGISGYVITIIGVFWYSESKRQAWGQKEAQKEAHVFQASDKLLTDAIVMDKLLMRTNSQAGVTEDRTNHRRPRRKSHQPSPPRRKPHQPSPPPTQAAPTIAAPDASRTNHRRPRRKPHQPSPPPTQAAPTIAAPDASRTNHRRPRRKPHQPSPPPTQAAPTIAAGMGLALLSWALLVSILCRELLGAVVVHGRWTVRFALILCASSELVKLRFFLVLDQPHGYFFFLYLSYVAVQGLLALLALAWYPTSNMQLVKEGVAHHGYLPLAAAASQPELATHEKACPEPSSGLFSRMTFSWMTPMMRAGFLAPLTPLDIWKLPPGDQVQTLQRTFTRYWSRELSKGPSEASLLRACLHTSAPLFLAALPLKLICDASQFVGPFFLSFLLQSLAGPQADAWKGYIYALLMFAGSMVGLLSDQQHFQLVMRAGFRLKALMLSTVHQQIFALSPAARNSFTSGRIFNLISSDAETLQVVCQFGFGLISSPIRIVVATYMLQQQLGPSSLVAILGIAALIPINGWLVTMSSARLKRALAFSDDRTKMEGELVSGIEVVKCSCWEETFKERIGIVRKQEVAMLNKVNTLQSIMLFVVYAVPTIIPVITFAVYMYLGHDLTSVEAFTALSLFNVLRFPLFLLPQLISLATQARVSLNRIQEFLVAEKLPPPTPSKPALPGEPAVSMAGDFSWDPTAAPSLTDIHLEIPAGQLVAVVGSTGSGKSSLISAMLGITNQVYGPPVQLRGKVAYVPQVAFLVNATVRENILFGLEYDPERYEQAVAAASLVTDLALFDGGDQMELGDRGTNISGGQKQRISIARALYANPDVAIFDDPLSALDANVGRKVFEQAIRGVLLGKTVVLATNQLQFVASADTVLYIAGGRILEAGTYADLLLAGGPFAAMMKEAQVEEESGEGSDGPDDSSGSLATVAGPTPTPTPSSTSQQPKATKLVLEERSSQGGVSSAVIMKYVRALGGVPWALYLVFGFAAVEALRVGATVWLSVWTDAVDAQGGRSADSKRNLLIYASISGVQLLFQLVNALDAARLGLRAATALHASLLSHILAAPMAFFHVTPLGRLVNRLSKDTTDVDRSLAGNLSMALRGILQLVSTVVLIGVIVPFALPVIVVILLFFYWLYLYFQGSVRQIKRLDAVSRSPVFSSISEAINGVATIRAFGVQGDLTRKHARLVDANVVMSLVNQSMNRWLSVRLESLSAVAALLAAAVAVEQRGPAGSSGLVIVYAMQITQVVSMTIRANSMAENMFNAVERVTEYDDLPTEGASAAAAAAAGAGDEPPAPGWPADGVVEFKNVAMRYRAGTPLVLRGVSFRAGSREKVAIVGRTGAGKSSMISCIFRLMEVESGVVEVDGVNIARIPLKALRSKMAIIPQVPVLFQGSIRMNLSPFGNHSDAQLWHALRRAHLSQVVESSAMGLETPLSEGGAPFSTGQKQLLALARALLNPSKILVLDEATANVDVETDALIQKTMRGEFLDRTIIAIAHRLHTVIDYDKILVLDAGQVAEFGAPSQLLENPAGVFSLLVEDTGEATAKFLRGVVAGKTSPQDEARASAAMQKLCLRMDSLCEGAPGEGTVPLNQLAAQLRRRAAGVLRLLKDAQTMVDRSAEDDSLSEQMIADGHDIALPDSVVLARSVSGQACAARRNLLQALALLSGVEELAGALYASGEMELGSLHPQGLMLAPSRSTRRRTAPTVPSALSSATSAPPGGF